MLSLKRDLLESSVTFLMTLTAALMIAAPVMVESQYYFDVQPCSSVSTLGEHAEFQCTVSRGEIQWFINNLSFYTLSPEIRKDITVNINRTGPGLSAIMRVLATELTNNSLITCAVTDYVHPQFVIFNYTRPGLLLVQGNVSSPVNVTAQFISIPTIPTSNNSDSVITVFWEEPSNLLTIPEDFDDGLFCIGQTQIISYYVVEICVGFNCTQNTVDTFTTEYEYLVNETSLRLCENDTEIAISVQAVITDGELGEKSNPTTPVVHNMTCDSSEIDMSELKLTAIISTVTASVAGVVIVIATAVIFRLCVWRKFLLTRKHQPENSSEANLSVQSNSEVVNDSAVQLEREQILNLHISSIQCSDRDADSKTQDTEMPPISDSEIESSNLNRRHRSLSRPLDRSFSRTRGIIESDSDQISDEQNCDDRLKWFTLASLSAEEQLQSREADEPESEPETEQNISYGHGHTELALAIETAKNVSYGRGRRTHRSVNLSRPVQAQAQETHHGPRPVYSEIPAVTSSDSPEIEQMVIVGPNISYHRLPRHWPSRNTHIFGDNSPQLNSTHKNETETETDSSFFIPVQEIGRENQNLRHTHHINTPEGPHEYEQVDICPTHSQELQ